MAREVFIGEIAKGKFPIEYKSVARNLVSLALHFLFQDRRLSVREEHGTIPDSPEGIEVLGRLGDHRDALTAEESIGFSRAGNGNVCAEL